MNAVHNADAVAPARPQEVLGYFRHVPNKTTILWWSGFLVIHLVLVSAFIAESTVMGYAVDALAGNAVPVLGTGEHVFPTIVGIGITAIVVNTFFRAGSSLFIVTKLRKLSIDLKRDCLSSVLLAPISEMMKLGTGNIITRMTGDIDESVDLFDRISSRLAYTLFAIPFAAITVTVINWRFGLVLLAVLVIVAPVILRWVAVVPDAANRLSATHAKRSNVILDAIRSLPTIRAFGFQQWAQTRMRQSSWNTVRATGDWVPYFSRLIIMAQVTYGLWLISSIVVAVYLIQVDVISVGTATTVIFLIFRTEIQIFNVIFHASDIQVGLTKVGRAVALALIHTDRANQLPADITEPAAITIENLSFSYTEEKQTSQHYVGISDLNLSLAAGTTTALVGPSGAGKSTLAALIAGLHRPTAGKIYIGTVDTMAVSDVWVARNVTLITQESHIFAGTLRQDLKMASPTSADDELLQALQLVGLGEDSIGFHRSFPQGLDTMVGAGAKELSPEVEQQIALARVVLRQPHVVILDEATSEAGSEHAEVLQQAAELVIKNRTALVVAHRLDQAMGADRIILMDDFQIIEDGTHAELLAAGGRYAQLFSRWSGNSHSN